MNPTFEPLFQPYRFNNGVEVKNRLVVAPMTHFASNEDGTLSQPERTFLHNRATDIGLFITAATLVAEGGRAFAGQPKALDERHLESLHQTAELIQSQGTKAILQIHHGGNRSPSELNNGNPVPEVTQYSEAEVEALVQAYANATDLAIQAGFDGVEIHGANGYLIQQFFSAQTNQRTDKWGGSLENRLRFPLAVVDAVNEVRAKRDAYEFIVGYRFSPEEAGENGLTMADTFALIDALKTKPLQYLHISLWDFYKQARRGADTSKTRLELVHQRLDGKLPLIGVGNLLTAERISQAYQTGWAEFIALGKAVMLNPNLATLLKEGREAEIVSELDPEQGDHYGIPDLLWSLCVQGGAWLPPVKGQEWQPMDI